MVADMNKRTGAFPVDRPVDALLQDHHMVRKLTEAYRNSDSMDARISAVEQVLMLLETHSLLEEQVFYPAVRQVDAAMISHFEEEHHKTDDMLAALKRMSLKDEQALPMFEQMMEMTLHHIEEEENEFFPKLEKANLDMTAIGLQMAAQEANAVHMQAQASAHQAHR